MPEAAAVVAVAGSRASVFAPLEPAPSAFAPPLAALAEGLAAPGFGSLAPAEVADGRTEGPEAREAVLLPAAVADSRFSSDPAALPGFAVSLPLCADRPLAVSFEDGSRLTASGSRSIVTGSFFVAEWRGFDCLAMKRSDAWTGGECGWRTPFIN